jgi:hypothetical protein
MAIAIKSIPTLQSREAKAFIKKADVKSKKRATIDFSKQVVASNAILEKSRLR